MGTRSRIAIRNADNTYTSIYCHWDGYPSGVGAKLLKHYTRESMVRKLLDRGDLSSLSASAAKSEAFRDRGEKDIDATSSANLEELNQLTQDTGGEWLYVFTPAAGWQCAKGGISFFGMSADKAPEGLESIDYWLQREAKESTGA